LKSEIISKHVENIEMLFSLRKQYDGKKSLFDPTEFVKNQEGSGKHIKSKENFKLDRENNKK